MDKQYHKQKGFNINLHLQEGNEMTYEHPVKLLIALDRFCEKFGYTIDLLETIVKEEYNEN